MISRNISFLAKRLMYQNYFYRNFAGSIPESNKEVDSAIKIQANLFENSTQVHKPLNRVEKLNNNNPKLLKSHDVFKKSSKCSKELKFLNDAELGLKFARLRNNDLLFSNLLTFLRSRKRQNKSKQIIVEGRRLILEALKCGLTMKSLFFSDNEELILIKDKISIAQNESDAKIYKISYHDLKAWSTLTTPPGLLAIFNRPNSKSMKSISQSDTSSITVICDNIREPNNLGSIIRTCAAIPCYQVLVTKGCCDPWEAKALRGGCGGQFQINVRDGIEWETIYNNFPSESFEDYALFIAENNKDKAFDFLKQKSLSEKFISYSNIKHVGSHNLVIIGGETHGISLEAYELFLRFQKGVFVHIPLAEGIESLNVNSALTLVLFELKKNLNMSEK